MVFTFVAVSLGLLAMANAQGHFHYGSFQWQCDEQEDITQTQVKCNLHFRVGLRKSYHGNFQAGEERALPKEGGTISLVGYPSPTVDFGDGSSSYIDQLKIVHVDEAAAAASNRFDLIEGTAVLEHTYDLAQASTFHATFSGCCRARWSVNNANKPWSLDATIVPEARMSSRLITWPHAGSVKLMEGDANARFVVATTSGHGHPEGNFGFHFPWKAEVVRGDEMCDGCVVPTGVSVENADSYSIVNFDTSDKALSGWYNMAFRVCSPAFGAYIGNDEKVPCSSVDLNVLVQARRTDEEGRVTNTAPVITSPPLASTVVGQLFKPLSIKLAGDDKESTMIEFTATTNNIKAGEAEFTDKDQFSVTWVFTPQNAGWYAACFEARDGLDVGDSYETSMFSVPHCVDINVMADEAPVFKVPVTAGPKDDVGAQDYTAYMNSPLDITICADDNNNLDKVDSVGISENSELARGMVVSSSRAGPCHDDEGAPTNGRTVHLTWTPDEKQGGLCSNNLCVTATDTYGQSNDLCFNICAVRCQWKIGTQETLADVAWRFDTNWMQIWALNVDISHPGREDQGWRYKGGSRARQERTQMFTDQMELFDRSVDDGEHLSPVYVDGLEDSLVYSGSIHTSEEGDSLGSIASTFGTTVEHIMLLNADVSRETILPIGKELCVMPNSCYTHV